MKKKVNLFGKKISVFVIALLAVVLVSAALIPYFGRITGMATVSQGLLVDGKSMPESGQITETWEPFTSLEEKTFVNAHNLDNQATVDAVLNLDRACSATTGDGCDDITTSYWKDSATDYAYSKTIGDVVVTVVDTQDGWLEWTYVYATSPTHTPKMTVAIDYPNGFAITTFDDGSHDGWYYAPDPDVEASRVKFGDYAGASHNGWVETTAVGNVLTVRIKKSALSNEFKWHGYANYNGQQVWINDQETGIGYEVNQFEVTIREALNNPFTVLAGNQLDFVIVNEFPKMLVPATYTITTTVNPAA